MAAHLCILKTVWSSKRYARRLYWQVLVWPSSSHGTQPDQCLSQIRPYHRYAAHEPAESDQEITKEDKEAVELDTEAYQRPAEEDKKDTQGERDCSRELLSAREEGERLLRSEYEG